MVTAKSFGVPGVGIATVATAAVRFFDDDPMAFVVRFFEALFADDAGGVLLAVKAVVNHIISTKYLPTYQILLLLLSLNPLKFLSKPLIPKNTPQQRPAQISLIVFIPSHLFHLDKIHYETELTVLVVIVVQIFWVEIGELFGVDHGVVVDLLHSLILVNKFILIIIEIPLDFLLNHIHLVLTDINMG